MKIIRLFPELDVDLHNSLHIELHNQLFASKALYWNVTEKLYDVLERIIFPIENRNFF